MAFDLRREHLRAGDAGATHHGFDNAIFINRLVESLPHTLVFERVFAFDVGEQKLIALLIHTQKDHAQLRALQHFEAGAAFDAGYVLHRHGFHHIDLAREQGCHAGRVVANRREDHFIHIAFNLAPIVAID